MATNRYPFTLRLPEDLFDKIGKLASAERRSMNNLIELIIADYFRRQEADQAQP